MKKIQAEHRSKAEFAMTKFWHRKDVMVVAAGSIPCIRELYILAEEMDTLHQFWYVRLTNEEYILGSAEEKIREEIGKAASVPGVQVVVFYLSCLDILVRLDFHDMEQSLSEETGKLVRCFYRGPLGKEEKEHVDADTFMQGFPKEEGAIEKSMQQLPVPISDGAAISDWMRWKNHGNVLVTPAGCRSCMSDLDMTEDQQQVYYPETTTSDFVFGLEGTTEKQARNLFAQEPLNGLSFIGTAVPAFMGMDGDTLADSLCEMGHQSLYFDADGFHDGLYGLSQAELTWARHGANGMTKEKGKVVQILGYSPLLGGDLRAIDEGISFLKSLGYEVVFDGETPLIEKPVLNWVISTAGIAAGRWMEAHLGIPLLIAYPVGAHAWNTWKKNVTDLIEAGTGERQLQIHRMDIPKTKEEKLLFVGDPVQIMGEAHSYWHEGYGNITLASLAWSKETASIIRNAPGGERFQIFHSLEELWMAKEGADTVFCDPILFPFFAGKKCIARLWGLLSGRRAVHGWEWLWIAGSQTTNN